MEANLRHRRDHAAWMERAEEAEVWAQRIDEGKPALPAMRALGAFAAWLGRTLPAHLASEGAPSHEAAQLDECVTCLKGAVARFAADGGAAKEAAEKARHVASRLKAHVGTAHGRTAVPVPVCEKPRGTP